MLAQFRLGKTLGPQLLRLTQLSAQKGLHINRHYAAAPHWHANAQGRRLSFAPAHNGADLGSLPHTLPNRVEFGSPRPPSLQVATRLKKPHFDTNHTSGGMLSSLHIHSGGKLEVFQKRSKLLFGEFS